MDQDRSGRRVRQAALLVGALIVILVIIWVDIATGVWQDLVILAGLAAGLVSFLLTVLVLNRILERSAAKRWAPVNRLALSEFLHAIADDEHSEISRGVVVPRSLSMPSDDLGDDELTAALHDLRQQVVVERRSLSDALSRWSQFLASSGDNETVLLHIADIALRFDRLRDAALEYEAQPNTTMRAALEQEVHECNAVIAKLGAELRARITVDPRNARESRLRV